MAGSSACRDPIAQLNRNFHRGRGHTLRLLSVDQIGYRGVCCGMDLVLRYDAVTCSTCGRSQPHWSDVAIVQATLHNCRDGPCSGQAALLDKAAAPRFLQLRATG